MSSHVAVRHSLVAATAAVSTAFALCALPTSPAQAQCVATGSGGCAASTPAGEISGLTDARRPAPSTKPKPTPTTQPTTAGGPTFTESFFDDFSRSTPGSWHAYEGPAGGNPTNQWDPAHLRFSDGQMHLVNEWVGGRWLTAGANDTHGQTYGRWEVRMRTDRMDDVSYHVLLWPEDRVWPPEIDIAEQLDSQADELSGFVHWNGPTGDLESKGFQAGGDLTQFHTVAVEWTPDHIVWTLDGREFGRTTDKAAIPDKNMVLAVQTESNGCAQRKAWRMEPCPASPSHATSSVDVDWIRISALN